MSSSSHLDKIKKQEKEKEPKQKKKKKPFGSNRLAGDCKHNIFTHFPKDPNCEHCQMCKTDRANCRVKKEQKSDLLPEPKALGDVN